MLVWLIEIYSLPLDLLTKLYYNEFCRAQHGRISSPSNLLLQSTSSPVYSPHKRGHSGPSIQLRLESQPMQAPISPACSLRSELNCTEWHSFYATKSLPSYKSLATTILWPADDLTVHRSIDLLALGVPNVLLLAGSVAQVHEPASLFFPLDAEQVNDARLYSAVHVTSCVEQRSISPENNCEPTLLVRAPD